MNPRSLYIYTPLITLVVGFALGERTSDALHRQTEKFLEKRSPIDRGDVVIRALRFVRDGNTNTVPFLETQLDESIVELSEMFQTRPKARWDHNAVRIIELIKEDRTKFPWRSENATVNHQVDETFTMISEAGTK